MMLKNKKAIITGGGRGIGKAVAEAFAKEGADILLISRTRQELEATSRELSRQDQSVIVESADVSKVEDVENIRRIVQESWGRVDILVNAAGIYGPIGCLEDLDLENWMQTFSVNIFGTVLMCRMALPFMKKQKWGRIINFSGGGEGPLPRFTAYSSSKGAVVRFTESLNEEVKGDNICVNAITPGPVNTAFLEEVLKAGSEHAGEDFYRQALEQKKEGGIPPEKAARLCLFLAGEEAHGIGGKVLSAVWDNWQDIPKHLKEIMGSDIYNFRRIKPSDRGYTGW